MFQSKVSCLLNLTLKIILNYIILQINIAIYIVPCICVTLVTWLEQFVRKFVHKNILGRENLLFVSNHISYIKLFLFCNIKVIDIL